jgi:hypothetical protein
MLTASVVASIPYMSLSIARFIPMEMGKRMLIALGQWADIAVTGIVAVINMTEEATVAMEPGAGTDEDAANKPVRPVIAIGGAVIRRVVKIPVRAIGRGPKIYADRDLGLGGWGKTHH